MVRKSFCQLDLAGGKNTSKPDRLTLNSAHAIKQSSCLLAYVLQLKDLQCRSNDCALLLFEHIFIS